MLCSIFIYISIYIYRGFCGRNTCFRCNNSGISLMIGGFCSSNGGFCHINFLMGRSSPVFVCRQFSGGKQVDVRVDPYGRPPADLFETLLDADGREYLPVFHQFAVEEADLHTESDHIFHKRFVLSGRETDIEAEIAVVAGVVSVPAVDLAQDGEVDADAVASVSLRKALYFPVGHEMGVQREIVEPLSYGSCHFYCCVLMLLKNRRLTFRCMKKEENELMDLVLA